MTKMSFDGMMNEIQDEVGEVFADHDLFAFVFDFYHNNKETMVKEMQRIAFELRIAFAENFPAGLPKGGDPKMQNLLLQHCNAYRYRFAKRPTLKEYYEVVREEKEQMGGGYRP